MNKEWEAQKWWIHWEPKFETKGWKIPKYILMEAHESKMRAFIVNGPKPNETRGKDPWEEREWYGD